MTDNQTIRDNTPVKSAHPQPPRPKKTAPQSISSESESVKAVIVLCNLVLCNLENAPWSDTTIQSSRSRSPPSRWPRSSRMQRNRSNAKKPLHGRFHQNPNRLKPSSYVVILRSTAMHLGRIHNPVFAESILAIPALIELLRKSKTVRLTPSY